MASSSTGIVATKQLVAHVPGQFDAAFVVSRGDIPAIRNVGDDDVCYQAPPPANTHKMYMCVFYCGPPRAEQLMTNTGTHQNPRWMCKPCNNARKAIEWMANKASDGQLKQILDEMKKNDPEAWKAKVRAVRVRDPAEPAGLSGLDNISARKSAISAFCQTLRQIVGITEEVPVIWLKRNQFISHMANVENVKDEKEADKVWLEHVRNRDIQRRGEGDNLQLAVNLPPRSVGFRTRALERSIQRQHGLESVSQAEKAIESVASVGAGQASLSSSVFGPMGDVFKVGASGSVDLDPAASVGFFAGAMVAPPASAAVSLEDFAPYGTSSGGEGKRGLAACVSDPANPKRPSKRPRFARSGVTGEVEEGIKWAKQLVKIAHSQYGLARVNLAKQVELVAAKTCAVVDADTKGQCARYQVLLQSIHKVTDGSTTWTASNMQAKKDSLQKDIDALKNLASDLGMKLANMKSHAKEAKEAKMKEERQSSFARERKLRGYFSAGAPPVLCRWLYSVEAIGYSVVDDGSKDELALEDTPDDASNSVKEVKRNVVLVNIDWHDAAQVIDASKPTIFQKDCKGPGQALAHLPEALGKHRIHTAIDKMEDFLRNKQIQAASSGENQETIGMLRLPPKGAGQDTLEAMTWVPEQWKKEGIVPEATRSYGAPWLLTGQPGSVRFQDESWAFPGMGRYLHVVSGAVILVTFCYEVFGGAMDFILTLALKTFSEFATKEFRVATLSTGCGAWIPYGWKPMLVTPVNEMQSSQVIDAVYFAGAFLKAHENRESLIAHNRDIADIEIARGNKPWDSIGQPFLDWLRDIDPPDADDLEEQKDVD